MKTLTKKYLQKKLNDIKESNEFINNAAANNPFWWNIDLKEEADNFLKTVPSDRIRVQIYQKHRINILQWLIDDLE